MSAYHERCDMFFIADRRRDRRRTPDDLPAGDPARDPGREVVWKG
jgi:hypothetical protein